MTSPCQLHLQTIVDSLRTFSEVSQIGGVGRAEDGWLVGQDPQIRWTLKRIGVSYLTYSSSTHLDYIFF